MNACNLSEEQKLELNQERLNINIMSIKSNFVLKKAFNFLQQRKKLEIIKYNKRIMKRLNISINDYKEYNEIEIEIISHKNKYGNFINIFNKEKEKYFHIYFNNDKETTNRTYLIKNEKVSQIIIKIELNVDSFDSLFLNCVCIKSINFKKFHKKNIIKMNRMFQGCSSLETINLQNFKTENVTDMSSMFFGCSSLKEIIFSDFNIDNVKDTSYMFYGCSSLKDLNVSHFYRDNIKNKKYMFYGCSFELKKKIKDQNMPL